MKKLRVVFRSEEKQYFVATDMENKYFLSVLVGGVANYEAVVLLNEFEVESFRTIGNLDDLAYDICKGSLDSRLLNSLPFVLESSL